MKDRLGDNHEQPIVRIQKATLRNFKSVKYGEVTFNCGKQFVPYGTESDILGMYGQNGSGKTAFIEATAILKSLLQGDSVSDLYADCIDVEVDYSKLEYTFELQYPNNNIRNVNYSFCLRKHTTTDAEKRKWQAQFENVIAENFVPTNEFKLVVFNECVSVSENFNGKRTKMQPVIDTSNKSPFGPVSKRNQFVHKGDNNTLVRLEAIKMLAEKTSQSFIFMDDTLDCFEESGAHSDYYEVLNELAYYAYMNLVVIDTKVTGAIQTSTLLPIFFDDTAAGFNTFAPTFIAEPIWEAINESIVAIDTVISALIPGINLYLKINSEGKNEEGIKGYWVELRSVRGDSDMPIRYESDGVKKIISVMLLIIAVYNKPSITVAIDEFDAGVFEYLLGEIIHLIKESGKGQLIFTSHNLRPLEVLDKKHLCFTTTNPENRYYRLKNIGASNNLRRLYFREIQVNEQDEELYKRSKEAKMTSALRKAWRCITAF